MPNGATFLMNPDLAGLDAQIVEFCHCINKLATLLVGRLLTHISLQIPDKTKH